MSQRFADRIGGRVKAERLGASLSPSELARRAGVDAGVIDAVERGSASPAVTTLRSISDALDLGLSSLLGGERVEGIAVTREHDSPTLWTSAGGGFATLLSGAHGVELWDWHLAPGDRHRGSLHQRGTSESLVVLSGALELRVGEECVNLCPGDAASFDGDQPHAYANGHQGVSRFLLAVSQPARSPAPPTQQPNTRPSVCG